MLAQCDPGPEEEAPWAIARRIYDRGFLSALAKTFRFEFSERWTEKHIVRIGEQYIYARRCEDDYERFGKDKKKEYERLLKSTRRFRDHLVQFRAETADITYELHFSARRLGEPKPQTDFPDITEHEKSRGEPYYLELLRLLKILDHGIDEQVGRLSPRKGRPKNNHGLDAAMYGIADFWIECVGGRFSVDYHHGTGTSAAFDFCKHLIAPLDDVPDTHIVTAMREVIRQTSEWEINTRSLDDILTEIPDDF